MNISAIIALVGLGLLFKFGLLAGDLKMGFLFSEHALIVVFGGTFVAAVTAFPIQTLLKIMRHSFKLVLFKKGRGTSNHQVLAKNIVEAARASRVDRNALRGVRAAHPFLAEGYALIGEGVLKDHDFRSVMQKRIDYYYQGYLTEAKILHSLAKFPPAMGLLGTVTGMLVMLGQLTGNPDAIGPSMAIAMVATFWGIAIANLVFNPLAEYYLKLAEEDKFQRSLMLEGLMLIKKKEPLAVVQEKLNSYLPAKSRLQDRFASSDSGAGGGRMAA